jgi:hypothetical protein
MKSQIQIIIFSASICGTAEDCDLAYNQLHCYADVVTVAAGDTHIVYVNGRYLVHGVARELLVRLVL